MRNLAFIQQTIKKPIFDPRIFWDVNFSKIDYDAEADFVIERIFEQGDVDDIRQCRRYYGDEMIRPILLAAKGLSIKNVYLAAAVLDEPVTDFLSYKIIKSA